MTQPIEVLVVDLDGTLLNEAHQLTERTEKALKAAVEKGVKVVIATGKTRYSAQSLIERIGLTAPGIYTQGLTIHQADGSISYQKTLDPVLARQVITFAEDRGYVVAAYTGGRILLRSIDARAQELSEQYGEPAPEAIGPLQNILDEMPINKLLIIKPGDPKRIKALRWQLEMQLDGKGRVTQAMVPDMLEVLPPDSSKGTALKVLLKQLGITPDKVMAIGDGENDIEMVQVAGIGIAMGNADDKLKAVADHVVGTNDNDGVAEAVERFILGENAQPEAAPAAVETADSNGAKSGE